MRKIKILMVTHGFVPDSVGGSEIYTYNLSKSLLDRGHQVAILTALDNTTYKRYEVKKSNLEGMAVTKIVNSPLSASSVDEHFKDPTIDELFREVLRDEEPDLIHFQHAAYLSGSFPEIAFELNIPSVLTLHDYWFICFRSRLLRPDGAICPGPEGGTNCSTCHDAALHHPMAVPRSPLITNFLNHSTIRGFMVDTVDIIPPSILTQARKLLFREPEQNVNPGFHTPALQTMYTLRYDFLKSQLRYPQLIISPSQHLKHRYEAEGYGNIHFLPIGFNRTDQVQTPPFTGQLKIAYIGNIERHKGVAVLLRELVALGKMGNLTINIYGRVKDTAYFAEVKNLAQQFPAEVVNFHGQYRSDHDMNNIFAQNHVTVFPSIWEENAPLVVREALLHGVPVVGSKLGGVSETIEDGVNGFLFDPFSEGELSGIVERLIQEKDVLERITGGARNTQIESMFDHVLKLTTLYEFALGENQIGQKEVLSRVGS